MPSEILRSLSIFLSSKKSFISGRCHWAHIRELDVFKDDSLALHFGDKFHKKCISEKFTLKVSFKKLKNALREV